MEGKQETSEEKRSEEEWKVKEMKNDGKKRKG